MSMTMLPIGSLIGVSAAGAQQNPPVNQPGVTDSEIRVGGVGTVSNDPTGNNPGGPAFDGTQAYFDYINASKDKGVCGRKLVLSSKRDDSLANNRQEIQGLLDDNVFAALPDTQGAFGLAEVRRADAPHKSIVMQRDGVEIGFAENGGDSEQDGAAILISNIDRARAEFQANGLEIGDGRIDERDGVEYQVFFVVAPDGLCYYFHQPLSEQAKA